MKIVISSKLMVNSCWCCCLINDFDICLCEDIEVNYIFLLRVNCWLIQGSDVYIFGQYLMRSSRSTIHTFWGLAALLYRVFESSLQSILNKIQRGNNYSYVQEFLFEFVLRHTSRMVKIYITYSPNRLSLGCVQQHHIRDS